ncbi:phage portal protein [Buttiauxella sp. 3AFRM03]|uniref:phage portal protein n=1 Tax=Buttiauxella sp. 3AFRM03 TaxID=2479367 RepID=UPI000EF788BD|nr:phage portal protein [Buttiauxella sp. 3AFRM03]AYN26418.1 phage portal protein [Buttiauxella sp. 3AFRM03]
MTHPVLVDVHGNPLSRSMGYTGGGVGFGGQMAEWTPLSQSADAALLPTLKTGNARADDLVRNNGLGSNIIRLHQDHIVGHMFRLSYRPNWKFLGMNEADAQAFVDDVEAAWLEFADSPYCKIDIEEKRTFTEFIREGVGVHAFNGEAFIQPVWENSSSSLFRTRFKMISPKRIENPYNGMSTASRRAGVDIDKNGKAVAYHVREGDPYFMGTTRYLRIPKTMRNGRPGMIHIFQPTEDGQTRGANRFYSVMERMKMLDTLQATQLQSVIVKSMYAATIESQIDTKEAMAFIAGADEAVKASSPLMKMLLEQANHYTNVNVKLGGVKIPHLYPGDALNLQSAQDSDNGYSALEKAILRYIAAGTGVSYEQLSRDYSEVSYSSARASANESWRYFMGMRKFIAARQASLMFGCWLEEVIARKLIVPPRARYSFWEARPSWQRSEWIGAGRMAIDGLKEVQESVMLIEAGLSTYEKELAKLGEDYQEIFRQQVRESQERAAAGLRPPVWIANTYNQQIADSQKSEETNAAT